MVESKYKLIIILNQPISNYFTNWLTIKTILKQDYINVWKFNRKKRSNLFLKALWFFAT